MSLMRQISDSNLKKEIEKVLKGAKNLRKNKMGLDTSHYFEESSSDLNEIRELLEDDSIKNKMEGMKRIIAMISQGRDASTLFPNVAKNVISKNLELKKLVYMYLVHYAEMEPDASLLAINSFQKDLSASNQYIRASALKVLSSIRVKILCQIILLAVKKCVKDSSPYVRKTAAHGICKVYALDHELKEDLIEVITVLLADRSTLVLGSALFAWKEVCPERFDLIHPHFRKFCHLLADIDEWGQINALQILLRYGRTQFENPNAEKGGTAAQPKNKKKKGFFDSDSEEDSDDDILGGSANLDPDHRLLLDSALSLLKSRNSGVVMAVVTLFYYLGPNYETSKVAKSLVRISRGKPDIEFVVLANIASIASARPTILEPYLADFFIKPGEPTICRNLKLEIITSLVNSENINKVLKEFKNYVEMDDQKFVTATIQAIGRCASRVPDVTDRCLHGLMSLIASNHSEEIVAESVVVIRKLLQMLTETEDHQTTLKEVIIHLSKLLENIHAPSARASITWVLGEYAHKVPKIAPDILRKLAKTFSNEDSTVKIQILNLASKLILTNPQQTKKLFEYVFTLARYDTNYDVRDKSRLLKNLLSSNSSLQEHAVQLLLAKKPIPSEIAPSEGRQKFIIGSMSHVLSSTAIGYEALPDFPEEAPDPSVRNQAVDVNYITQDYPSPSHSTNVSEQNFWESEEELDSEEDEDEEEESEEEEEDEEEDDEEEDEEEEEEEEEESEEEDFWTLSTDKKKDKKKPSRAPAPSKKTKPTPAPQHSNDLDELFSMVEQSQPLKKSQSVNNGSSSKTVSLDDLFSSVPANLPTSNSSSNSFSLLSERPKHTLLKPHVSGGLEVQYSFVRIPSMHGATINTVQLYFKNHGQKGINNIRVEDDSNHIIAFPEISVVQTGATAEAQIGLKFESVSKPAKFQLCTEKGKHNISIPPNYGELVRPSNISPEEFESAWKKLGGMNENSVDIRIKDSKNVPQSVMDSAWLAIVSSDFEEGKFSFAGQTMVDDVPLLFSVNVDNDSGKATCTIKSENTILNSMLLKQLQESLSA